MAYPRQRTKNDLKALRETAAYAKELRAALAGAIGALRNACVGAASSTAELLGGDDPTGFAQEVRALAEAHARELEEAMAQEEGEGDIGDAHSQSGAVDAPTVALDATSAQETDAQLGLAHSAERRQVADAEPGEHADGADFWARQSSLWSGVFAEQQAGLLQMVRAQEAELRQGKQRIGLLERQLSVLNDKQPAPGMSHFHAYHVHCSDVGGLSTIRYRSLSASLSDRGSLLVSSESRAYFQPNQFLTVGRSRRGKVRHGSVCFLFVASFVARGPTALG